eukprot:CAMPEP_0197303470 /NCGR_PEP_ID=MMETSP0890-20130614/51678_1 /TAXON_ID=44058 ORGANISM="Aureoumbra lagunensis, Strain CCMP1510" /NCGR_SAMPLE_ID=MMETSP0890 /ASSEMBLY_ACC=CAM_ASM_000533 /LENGTH=44 /DNA_ID= /DNA_START= /DNA_END= /DNA_ORIENTATION=
MAKQSIPTAESKARIDGKTSSWYGANSRTKAALLHEVAAHGWSV